MMAGRAMPTNDKHKAPIKPIKTPISGITTAKVTEKQQNK